MTDCMPSGTYYLFAAPDFSNIVPCAWPRYQMTVEMFPCILQTGACCTGTECHDGFTAEHCASLGGHYQGDGTTCPQDCVVQPGETCDHPKVVSTFPYDDVDDTCNFYNDYDEACPFPDSTAPDVVYLLVPPYDILLRASLCNEDTCFDTKLYIYEGGCPGTLIACNDDFCSTACFTASYVSQLDHVQLYAGQSYYIVVDGYGASCGPYHLSLGEYLGESPSRPPDRNVK